MGNTERKHSGKIVNIFLCAYMIGVAIAMPCFYWGSIKADGFWLSLINGVPPEKAFIWPYYLWQNLEPTSNVPAVSKVQLEIDKLRLALTYGDAGGEAAGKILAKLPPGTEQDNMKRFLADCHNQQELLSISYKARDTGNSIDEAVLNGIYPDLGTNLKRQWLEGMINFIDACESGSMDAMIKSSLPTREWRVWYDEHGDAVWDAVKSVEQ